jgi:hypothetical protein
MKGWADHSSSEDEDEAPERFNLTVEEIGKPPEEPQERQAQQEAKVHKSRPPKTYVYPTEPPFSAFVGNVAFSIVDPNDLANELVKITKEKLGVDIVIENPRIVMDRHSEKQQHRGFAYVQVQNVDQLKALIQLNDFETVLAGRKIHLDTANGSGHERSRGNNRRGPANDIDGSKFRGGRYNRDRRGNSKDFNHEAGDEVTRDADSNIKSGPPAVRPTLKLQPRSKPLDVANQSTPTNSSIFGGAKANDAGNWRSNRKSEEQSNSRARSNHGASNKTSRDSRRGNTATSAISSSSTQTGPRKQDRKDRDVDRKKAAVVKKSPVAPVPPVQQEPKKEDKVVNKFAVLDFDSDSD